LGEQGYLTADFEEMVIYQGTCRRKLWKWVYLSIGEPGGGSVYWELLEIVEGGLWKRSISLCVSSVRGAWRRGSFTEDPE